MRVLLSAFACDPVSGSDEEVGWQWAKELAVRGVDVTVITRKSHQLDIEHHVAATGQCKNAKFVYVDIDWLHALLHRVNPRNHIYYYFWQWVAYRAAARLHAITPFDLIHHVTWVSFRQPSFMGLLGSPMLFGPVAGGDEIPQGYARAFSLNQRLIEILRGTANFLTRYDPFMRMTFNSATRIYFTSDSHLQYVSRFVREKAAIELAIGCNINEINLIDNETKYARQGNRLLFVGRCIGWKGMDIGLLILARIRQARPDVTLTIIGDGVDRARWMKKAKELGLEQVIDWCGWLPKPTVLDMYAKFDVLFYPSLRDSGGFVVLEALQCGLPAVVFKLGGPGVVVDETCGARVEASANREETIHNYATAVLTTLQRVRNDPALPSACCARAANFTWDALIDRIYGTVFETKKRDEQTFVVSDCGLKA